MNDKTRLDRAIALLKASDQAGCHVDRWRAMSGELSGLELTGATDDVRQAIESFGVACNAIMQPYQTSAVDPWDDLDEADATKLVERSRGLAEFIQTAESERILARLRHHGGVFPEAEIIEARRHRVWFTSLLIDECQSAIDAFVEDTSGEADQHNSILFLSLFLFSEWNVVESVPIVLQALKLPGEGPFDLFGDGVHGQVPRYLAQFVSGDPDCIDELIRNPNGNPYVRWASASSYKYLVRDRAISFDDAVHRLDRLFDGTKVADENGRPGMGHPYEVSSGIVEVITSIGGGSRSKISDHDYDWDFVDESIFDREGFGETPDQDDPSELPSQLTRLPPTRLEDCVEVLRDWAAFAPKQKPNPSQRPATLRPDNRAKPRTLQPADQGVPPPKLNTVQKADRPPRNARCPCGSGKKYKQCCLRQAKMADAGKL